MSAEMEEKLAATVHEELFTSGAYVREFRPDASNNPFARDYERKRQAVIAEVKGVDQRVLDVGGGMGRMAVPLSRHHYVTLTDISSQMLELARPHASDRLTLRQADGRHLPFGDDSFDYVLGIDVLPHIPKPERLLAELRRVLRPGGVLIIDATNSIPFWTLAYPSYVGRHPRRWLEVWGAGGVLPEWRSRVRHHRRRELVELIHGARFNLRNVRTFGPRPCPKWFVATAVKL